MRPADGKVLFKEWLPDQPDLDNPGLTEATNVLDLEGSYRPFRQLGSADFDALASRPLGGIVAGLYTYVGLATSLQRCLTTLGTWTDYSQGTSYTTTGAWSFARYEDLVVAATKIGTVPQVQTLGSGSDFANLASTGTCPISGVVGKIGQFVLVGNTSTATYHVQWSAIADPRDWPTPDTADATSKQSGQQYLNPEWGDVTGIVGGDQFGIIFQKGGLTRVTYGGGNVAFQFDEVEGAKGCEFPNSIVEFGGGWYYLSKSGFYLTDGVKCVPIGDGKVDQYFWNTFSGDGQFVWGALDQNRKIIFWAYEATALSGSATRILAYNIYTQRFTRCNQNLNCLLSQPERAPATTLSFRAFNTSHEGCTFDGSALTGVITTAETEFHPGGRTLVQGVKPLVTIATGVTPTITVALGTRNDQDIDSLTYTSETAPTTRTGFADFRSDARYHRARVTMANFETAMGLEVQAVPSGAV